MGSKGSRPLRPVSRRQLLRMGGTFAAAGAAAPYLASCARAPAPSSSGGGDGNAFNLYWNAGHAYKAYAAEIKKFESDHGIKVKWQQFQWPDLRTQFLSDLQAGTAPDLMETPGAWPREFGASGDALSLQEYIAADGKDMGYPDDWLPSAVDRTTLDGTVYGIQLHWTCIMNFYNQTMLDQAGISSLPETWDDFLAVAKRLTKGNVHGCALNQDKSYSWPWMFQNKVHLYDAKGPSAGILTPHAAAIEALGFQADLVHQHKVSPVPVVSNTYSGPRKLFIANRAAMFLSGPWDILPIEEGAADLQYTVGPALRNTVQKTEAAGSNVMIPKNSRHPDLAWDLIKRFAALETEQEITKEANMTMPRKSWAETEQVKSSQVLRAFADGLTYAVPATYELAPTGKFGEVYDAYQQMYQEIVIQNKPANEAVPQFAQQVKQLLAG